MPTTLKDRRVFELTVQSFRGMRKYLDRLETLEASGVVEDVCLMHLGGEWRLAFTADPARGDEVRRWMIPPPELVITNINNNLGEPEPLEKP